MMSKRKDNKTKSKVDYEADDAELGLFGRALIVYMKQKGDTQIRITNADVAPIAELSHDKQLVLVYVEDEGGLTVNLMSRGDSVKFAKKLQ